MARDYVNAVRMENIHMAFGNVVATTSTGTDGKYRFTAVTPGPYTVRARLTEGLDEALSGGLAAVGYPTIGHFLEDGFVDPAIRSLLDGVTIEEPGFAFEPEITAKLAKQRPRVYEVGVSYHGRTFAEGKKIRWRDGLHAVFAIVKYNLFR